MLLIAYIDIYKNLRSNFTLGLIVFTIALLLQSVTRAVLLLILLLNIERITQLPTIVTFLGYDPVYAIIPDILEFISLSILIYFTRQ